MITLKDVGIEHDTGQVKAIYSIVHHGPQSTLDQDLAVSIDPVSGKIKGELQISGLVANDMDEVRLKLAEWLDRLAAGLREPMQISATIPVFGPKIP